MLNLDYFAYIVFDGDIHFTFLDLSGDVHFIFFRSFLVNFVQQFKIVCFS